jgi:hypothetical protein
MITSGSWAHGRDQAILEAGGILSNLPLYHDGFFAAVQVLDGVFQGYDHLSVVLVDLVDDAGKGWWTCPSPVGPVTSTRPFSLSRK